MSFHGRFQPGRGGCGIAGSNQDSSLFRTFLRDEEHQLLAAEWRGDRGQPDFDTLFGLDGPDHLADRLPEFGGDFAFALFDRRSGALTVGLAPLSELELHCRVGPGGSVQFATSLADLLTPGELPDPEMLGKALRFAAFFDEEKGFYRGIRPVHPGTTVTFGDAGAIVHRFWDPTRPEPLGLSRREAGARLRHALTDAVSDRIAAVPGRKASLLSAGRDSSAVTAVTATLLIERGERLDSWTAAAFPGAETARGHLLDEAPVAAQTAKRFANIDHHIVRPRPVDLCATLDHIHRQVAVPIVQPLAVAWCETLWNGCEQVGDRLLMSGDFGNYALSAGGPLYLDDVRSEEGTGQWFNSGLQAAAAAPTHIRPLASGLLRRHLFRPACDSSPLLPFLRGDLLDARRAAPTAMEPVGDSYRSWLRKGMRVAIASNDVVRIGRQLELTDPTRDRRVVDLVNALPAKLLASAADRRSLFDEAFGDLLPMEVLRPKARGRQNVDWHYHYPPDTLRTGLRRYSDCPLVRSMIDCDVLMTSLDDWPSQRTLSGPVYDRMIWGVLPALAMASFLYTRGN